MHGGTFTCCFRKSSHAKCCETEKSGIFIFFTFYMIVASEYANMLNVVQQNNLAFSFSLGFT